MNVIVNGIDLKNTNSVLLQAPHYMGQDDLIQLKSILEYEFPEVKFVILSGEFEVLGKTSNVKIHVIEGRE